MMGGDDLGMVIKEGYFPWCKYCNYNDPDVVSCVSFNKKKTIIVTCSHKPFCNDIYRAIKRYEESEVDGDDGK